MARMVSCLILLLVCCVVDREMYDGRYEIELFTSAEDAIGDFGSSVQHSAGSFAPAIHSHGS